MAALTLQGKTCRNVIGIFNRLVVCLMTGNACQGRIHIALAVAGDAIQRLVRSRQREVCLCVIKRRRIPAGSRVTVGALKAEAVRRVIRVVGILIVLLVAGVAVCGDGDKNAIFMTVST